MASAAPEAPALSGGSALGRLRSRFESRHLLALPSVGWTVVFFLAPLVILFVYSFGSTNPLTYQVEFGWTFSNYTGVFQSLYLDTVLRSLALSAGSTVACLLVGFPVAYTIARAKGWRQVALLLLVLIPFWTSFIVRTYGIYNLISDNGPLYQILRDLGLVHGYINILYSPIGVAIGIVYTYLPLMVLPLFVALERIDESLLDAAHDLGAGPIRVMRRVILPLALPGIIGGCILVGIPATGEYVIPQILGGGKTLMFGNVVADQFLNIGDDPFGAAMAVVVMLVLLAVLVFLRWRTSTVERRLA
jgi:ABC-type spermidine/putrescine transport system permease subunit I